MLSVPPPPPISHPFIYPKYTESGCLWGIFTVPSILCGVFYLPCGCNFKVKFLKVHWVFFFAARYFASAAVFHIVQTVSTLEYANPAVNPDSV